MPTIDEIAKLARVSPTTVSKVLNNRPYVSQATRRRVEHVIAETGFVPSQWARLLSQRRSYILGLLIPYTSDQLFADPHLLEVMRGIESAANRYEYNLLLSTGRAPVEAASACTRLLRSDVIDGAVVVETQDLRAFAETLGSRPAPWVVLGYAPAGGVPAVHADDYGGARDAMHYLISQGHRRIGVVSSTPRPFAIDERMRGLQDAIQTVGLTLDSSLVVLGDFSTASGEQAGHTLLTHPNPPTAIFALNDRMAIGVVRAATARGLRVPEQLSVIGFDDIALATLLTPQLTTVRQPGYILGETTAETLFALLDPQRTIPSPIIPTSLIVRGSVQPPERG